MRTSKTLTLRGYRTNAAIAAALAALLAGTPMAGAQTAPKCAIAKSKAAGKKLTSKLKCQQKANATGLPVDPACLGTAETKFDNAIAKIEARGGCAVIGDAAKLEDAVDECVAAINQLTPATVSTSSTTTSTSTTTTTSTTLPAYSCPMADGSSCGSCGDGVCLPHFDTSQPANICVDASTAGSANCSSDASCGAGRFCAFSRCFDPCP